MAEKKTWRDYIKQQEPEESTSEKKTGTWRDYIKSSTDKSDKVETSGGWRDYISEADFAGAIGDHIVGRINAFSDNHNAFLTDYQNRFSGRKGTYEDAYVSDSASYLDTVTQQSAAYKQEYQDILDYLDKNSKYLNPEWVSSVKASLTETDLTSVYDQIVGVATQDDAFWKSFEPKYSKFDVGTAKGISKTFGNFGLTAEKKYEKYQRESGYLNKYQGKTSEEIKGIYETMDSGQERRWLEKYAASVDYDEKSNADIDALKKEQELQAAELMANFDKYTWDELNAELAKGKEKDEYIKAAEEIQEYNRQYEYYNAFTKNADFAEKSAYKTTYVGGEHFSPLANRYTVTGFEDITYDYINRNETARNRQNLTDIANYSSFTGTDKSYLQEMTDDEIAIYNYLYATNKSEAEAYLGWLTSDLNARQREREQAQWAADAKEHPITSSLFSVAISPLKILSAAGQFADYITDGEIDHNAGYNKFSYIPSTIRGQVASDIAESGKWGEVGSWTYQLGMSMGDFLMTSAVSGGNQALSLTLMGSGAMADTVISAKDRGLSDDQAMILGVVAGGAEIITEKFSLDALFKGDMSKGAMRYILTNAFTEGTEEVSSSLINTFADILVAKDKSEWAMAIDEYMANNPDASESEAFNKVLTDTALSLGLDFLGGALMGGGMGSGGATINYAFNARPGIQENIDAIKKYGSSTNELIQEGLLSDPNSDSYDLAKYYQKKTTKGKELSGYEIRSLVDANKKQFQVENYNEVESQAKTLLTELGETKKVNKLANLVAKYVSGQELTKAEKSTLARSEHGAEVAKKIKEMSTASETQEENSTKSFNVAYKKADATYKPLEERVGNIYPTAESGKATIHGSNEEISLDKVEVVDFVKDKETGKVTDMVLKVDGKEVNASDIDFPNDIQSYLYAAVSKIENITPAAATAIVRDYDPSSGQTVGEYLNGIDEAYTYGYYGYNNADLKAGNFAPKLTDVQAKSAYLLGQTAKKNSNSNKTEAIKQMRTAVDAEAEKAKAEKKKAPKSKKMTVAYDKGNGETVEFSKAEMKKLSGEQRAGVAIAKILHKLGLGTNFEFFSSYLSDNIKVKDKETGEMKAARVYVDESGAEVAAPAGAYRKSDGTIRIDLNAYNGKKLTLYAMAHELTHFIQQWSAEKYQALVEFLIKTYDKTDKSMHQRVLIEQARLQEIRGEEVSYDEAFDEVVANAMMKMLDDKNIAKTLAELKAQDANLAEKLIGKIKELIDDFINALKEYKKYPYLFDDTSDIMALEKEFEQLKQMWAEALVEASENFQAYQTAVETEAVNSLGENAKVETNEAGELLIASNESGNVLVYSEQTYLDGGRDKLEMALRQNGHTDAEIKETLSYVDDALDYIKILAAGYAKEMGYNALSNHLVADIVTNVKTGKQVMSAIVNNGDYPVNIDLSLICKKRVAYMNLMSRLIRDGVFDKVNYDGAAIAEVNEILRENGFETACLGCFVESRRLQFQTWAETIVSEWNAEVEKRNPNAENFGFAKGKMEGLSDADIDALTRELESVKKNDQGNVNLGQGNSVTRMGRLLDALPSLQKKLTVEDLLTPEGLTALRKHDGSLFSIVKSRYGAASPKIVQDFNPYASEIAMLTFAQVKGITNNAVKGAQAYITEVKNEYGKLTKTKGESKENFKKRKDAHEQRIQDEAMRRYLYDIGGARIQSFSDFMIENIFDYIQIFADLAAKRLPLHGYTKEIVCLRLFGMTGGKWNGSLIAHVERSMGKELAGLLPAGTKDGIPVRVDGKDYVIGFDDYARNASTNGKSFIQSIGMKDIIALQLDPRYSPYVGSITIGVSDAQILAMLDSPLFRMVIPYHASGMLPMFAKLVGVDMYNDYTDYQNTTVRQYYDTNGNAVSELKNSKGETVKADTSYAFNAEIQKTKDAKVAANNYLKWCAQRHPVYDGSTLVGYATFNPKFSSSPFGTDFTRHENYYKLLEDFNTYDCITEESVVQGPVTMNFPSEENRLTDQQMEEYKNALRETGIFTEKDIEKYAKKADMTFKEIIAAEVGNRANYAATQAPKWESTVKEVEEKLQKDYAREQHSSQETDIDIDAKTDYDGVEEMPTYVTHKSGQDVVDVDHKLWSKKREEAKQAYGLDETESDSVDNYVAGKAYEWNAILRGDPNYERTEFVDFWVQQTINGLTKFPQFVGRTYRNLSFGNKDNLNQFLAKHQAGMDVDVEYFASSSKDPNGYVVSGDYIVHMVIDGFEGRDISDSYAIPGQQEVIHLPGTKLRITSVKTANDGHPLIYAQEVKGNGKNLETNYGGNRQDTSGTNNERQAGNAGGKRNDIRGVRYNQGMEGGSDSRNAKVQRSGDYSKEVNSTQETNIDSNRAMLANAFEGLSQNSKEYEKIQEYKGRIKILNEYEDRLAKVNAEIYDMTFGKDGERDSKKLKQLRAEAKELAEHISRNDKILLNMEASAPLRGVIEQERKKASQKTKEHLQQIVQNKKARAEQTEIRHKIRKAIRDLDKILNRGNKKSNVKEDLQPVVTKALQAAEVLFTDNYGTYDMLRNGLGVDLSDPEEALVKSCTQMLKDLDKMPADGYENWQARQEAETKLRTKMSKLNEVFARERKRLNNTTVSSILGELADAYAKLDESEQSYVQGAYSEPVHNFLKSLQSEVGGTIVMDMTKDQLESVYAAYKMVLTTVRKANQMFNEELKLSREQLGNAVIEEVLKAGGVHLLGTPTGSKISQFSWNNMKPIWVANRIGSETFGKLMNGLFKGQYNFAVDIDEVKKFKLSMDQKYHPREWDAEKLYEFQSSTGKEFSLNLQQIMSLYAFSKREQAYSHLLNGGFAFEKNSTVIVEENGKKKTYIHKGATTYKLNEATLNGIINSLTADQKAYVDEMQKFLSETMGAKGNEVSMQLYGIKMFNEQFYFPLRSSGDFMEKAKAAELKKEQGQINLVNSGFTHSVKPEAKNPIILSGFMDVWAEHCNEMSMYHSMVLPMEDFRKVYNYTTVHDSKMDSASVQQTIIDAYGEEATKYIDQLYSELNAGATVDPRETTWKKLISNFKKSAVMLSGSVFVQQFSSIGRAYAVIDPKYFAGAKVNSDTKLSVVEEMKKYAPVAIIKEMGGFDTGTKGSAKSYIMAEQYGKGERTKGFIKDEQYRGDIMGILPAWADQKTWCAIWEATKRETKAKHPKIDVKSEEFLKLAGERFSEVIEKTQVYDSILARSANMRSKGNFMAMATAFMAEPTTTINLLEDAIRSGNAKHIARAFGSVAVSILLNNALASIVYAMRDDDEDETFIEKYFQAFTSGMIDDINPMSYYPFFKDVYSMFQGYDVERTDMSVIGDIRDATKQVLKYMTEDTSEMDDDELAKHNKNLWGALGSLLDAGCSMFGVPVKNVRRDVNGLINAFNTVGEDISGERDNTWRSFWDKVGSAVKDTIPVYALVAKDKPKSDKLYEAIISGDDTYLERLKGTYKDDDAYHTAVRKALRDNDPRIKEAAQAHVNGDPSERVRITKLIKADGFDQDDVVAAINTEINKLTKSEDESDTTKAKGLYKAVDFVQEYANGDMAILETIREDILATAQENGKTLEDAEKDFTSNIRSEAMDMYLDGDLDDATAHELLMEYVGKDEEDATAIVNCWALRREYPEYKSLFNESNVAKYHEFAEPAEIPVDVYAQYLSGARGIKPIRDKWGDVVKDERSQKVDVIHSLPLTSKQKDALYLAADLPESKIWDVHW